MIEYLQVMSTDKNLSHAIEKLETERVRLRKKSGQWMPWLVLGPLVVLLLSTIISDGHPAAIMFMTSFAAVISMLMYASFIGNDFKKLKNNYKSILLDSFMTAYHPTIDFKYSARSAKGRSIIKASKLIKFNRIKEEDVIRGKKGDADFYLSEVELIRGNGKNQRKVFKGLLFKIKIPGKSFPFTRIQSEMGILENVFNDFKKHAPYGFWYETGDEECLEQELGALFPFISHLTKGYKKVRVSAFDDEITILLDTDMKFMDTPKPSLHRSFHDDTYFKNLGVQINSLLYIIEAFVNNLENSEIEETLELKRLELVERLRT